MYHFLPTAILLLPLPLPIFATTTILNLTPLLPPTNNPWSHEPHCTTSKSLTHLGQTFCVYTSNSTGPYGLSLILPPHAATTAIPTLTTNPIQSFLTHQQAQNLYLRPPPWAVVNVPGKDKGVVATRRIAKYETLMIDQAAVVIDKAFDEAVAQDVRREMLGIAVRRLYTPGTVLDMARKHAGNGDGGSGSGSGTVEEDVVRANAFGSRVGGVETRALYPLISRINHACDPNAYVMFSKEGVSMAIKAYRDIEEGEEITVSYLLLGAPSAKRAKIIEAHWGFECTCTLCFMPPLEKKASDIRRLLIAQAETKAIELARAGKVQQAIDLALETVDMIKDEGLESMLTDEYAMLAMLYLERGDRDEADKWGRRAWDLLGRLGYLGVGEDGEDMGGYTLEVLLEGIGGLGGDGGGWGKGRG